MGAAPPPGGGQGERLADALAETRGRGFVGRDAELRSFADALTGSSDCRILFLHGPGGMGETTLLDAFARHARQGRSRARLRGRPGRRVHRSCAHRSRGGAVRAVRLRRR